MFKHVDQTLLERVARAMCEADHNEPDQKVPRYLMPHLNGIAQHKTYVPTEQHTMPAWELYAHLVPAAIEALEASQRNLLDPLGKLAELPEDTSAKKWLRETMPDRLAKPGPEMVIKSRAHDCDVPGLIEQVEREEWDSLKIPTSYELGQNESRAIDFLAINKAMG